jgi:hypothetical protein
MKFVFVWFRQKLVRNPQYHNLAGWGKERKTMCSRTNGSVLPVRQSSSLELPDLFIVDENNLDLTITNPYEQLFKSSAVKPTKSSEAPTSPEPRRANVQGGEDWFMSKLANICAQSDQSSVVDNLVNQSCGIVGFGPMVSALEELRA